MALKFYLPEEGHEEALKLLEAEESGAAELLAPGTILLEGFNAIVWQQKRGLLDAEDAGERLTLVTELLRTELRAMNVIASLPATEVARTRWSPN